ncbi:hypothetical protein LS482_09630 [Sinomicrobium kalidii]|uniref:hypothetical protein n=1 Tax=Sinomicrobium kalidii TaxID=2900738 RepID=UPI001E314979|nr:hypothetical protein [Sinomicrobium kalidii]UGU18127.1 hypothetical protein LS482_09630 [Sinomicrobium kalidii]
MKIIFSVVFIMVSVFLGNAQKKPSEIFLHTGEKLVVKGKIKGQYFQYKLYNKAKKKEIHFRDIDHVNIRVSKDNIETYRWIKVKNSETPEVLKEVQTGEVSLYIATAYGATPISMGGGFGGGFNTTHAYTINNYYLLRTDEEEATHLGSDDLFTKNFKQAASRYFKDCPLLVKKIEDKAFKKRHLKAIVSFYNTKCNQGD